MAKTGGSPRLAVADLYELWTLDVIPSIGVECAQQFRAHPQRFKNVPGPVVQQLSVLQYRTGNSEDYLDRDQRSWLIMPLLGSSDGEPESASNSSFHNAAAGVRAAAKAYTERVYDTAVEELRNAFRASAIVFEQYLTTLSGGVVDDALARVRGHFDTVVSVLRDPEFANGFGLKPNITGSWPLNLDINGVASILVQTIWNEKMRRHANDSRMATEEWFQMLQRIASYGALTVDRIAKGTFGKQGGSTTADDETNEVISLAYQWYVAICQLVSPWPSAPSEEASPVTSDDARDEKGVRSRVQRGRGQDRSVRPSGALLRSPRSWESTRGR
jgi:hypothetical protein